MTRVIFGTGLALTSLLAPLPGCGLIGVEPDEIDILEGETGGLSSAGSSADAETGAESMGGTATDGDTDTDPDTGQNTTGDGDGDGDPDTGPGETTDPTGDGDGDPSTTGGGDNACLGGEAVVAMDGDNPFAIPDQPSNFAASCGPDGPDQLFEYTATATALVNFEVADAEASVTVLDLDCNLGAPLACAVPGEVAQVMLDQGSVVYVIVDAAGPTAGTLAIY